MTEKQRNALLAEMTDEVGLLVLRDNYYQTQALSIAGRYAVELLDAEARLMRWLERAGRLNRVIEFLPTDDEVAERQAAKLGLTSPERAVLLAYSKMWLYDALLESDVPEDPLVAAMLVDYFPKPLQQRFSEPMRRHPLRREILATHLTNALVNRVGCAFVHRLMEETDAKPGDIVRACIMARDVFDLDAVWRDIDALDNRVADDVQARMFVDVARLLERAALWFLRHLQSGAVADGGVTELIARCRDAAERLAPQLPSLLPAADLEALSERQRVLVEAGVDSALAVRVASGDISAALLDIAEVAATSNRSLELVAGVYSRSARCLTTAGSASARRRCRRRRTGTCWRARPRSRKSRASSARWHRAHSRNHRIRPRRRRSSAHGARAAKPRSCATSTCSRTCAHRAARASRCCSWSREMAVLERA